MGGLLSRVFSFVVDNGSDTGRNQCNGHHETQVSKCEADLHRHFNKCKKNPGHINFIPVSTFCFEDLPEGYRSRDLFEHIKATADLTVRVGVNGTSPHRPKFWPGTKEPYPFHNEIGKERLRVGTGLVRGYVYKFTGEYSSETDSETYSGTGEFVKARRRKKCWCKKCQDSGRASLVWWEFEVFTAAHVIFDDMEASHTSLRFFYDKEECPVIIVNKVNIYKVDFERDHCILKCVTCNIDLADKLNSCCKRFSEIWWMVRDKYRKSRDVDKFSFMVSHPHGCSKQISIGHWVDKVEVGKYKKITYTMCTCPGSSGAYVHCLGYDWWLYHLVHKGSQSNINYSGAGGVLFVNK